MNTKRIALLLAALMLFCGCAYGETAAEEYELIPVYGSCRVVQGNIWLDVPNEWPVVQLSDPSDSIMYVTADSSATFMAQQMTDEMAQSEMYAGFYEESVALFAGESGTASKLIDSYSLNGLPAIKAEMIGQGYEMVWVKDEDDLYFMMYTANTPYVDEVANSFRLISPKTPIVCNEADYETETLADGTLAVTAYKGTEQRVLVPATIGGKAVTKIGDRAFYEMDVSWVEVPQGVTELGEFAFSGCNNLTKIVLPEGIETLPAGLFESCPRLNDIQLPSSIKRIESSVFWYNSYLEQITLPASLEEMGTYNFASCPWLDSITLPEECKAFEVQDGGTVLIGDYGKRLVRYVPWQNRETYAVPQGVEVIDEMAFADAQSLTDITLPDGVREIGGGAFFSISTLERITMPDSVEKIGVMDVIVKDDGTMMLLPSSSEPTQEIQGAITSQSVTLCAPEGSVAQAYAEQFGLTFEAAK